MMKLTRSWMIAFFLVCSAGVLTSCSKDDDNSIVNPQPKEYFTLWNSCEALTALQDYVKDVTDPTSKNFIREEDREIAHKVADMVMNKRFPNGFNLDYQYAVINSDGSVTARTEYKVTPNTKFWEVE